MAAPLGPNEKPPISPPRAELPKSADDSSQNVSAAASKAINELSQAPAASSSVLKASQTGNSSEAARIESAVDYFSKIITAVKQNHIYSSFSPTEIALLKSVSRQENAAVKHSHQVSLEIAQLLDNLSQKVINSKDYSALDQLIRLQTDLEGVKKFLPIAKKIDDLDLKNTVLISIAKQQASLRDIDGAMETAALIIDKHRRIHALYAILLAQIESKDFEKAKETVKKMYKNSFDENDALSKIALAQAKAQDFEGAKVTANPILDTFRRGDVYANIAKEQIFHHDYEAAKLTMSQESVDKLKLFSLMAKEQLRTQNLEAAQQTLILAKEVAYQIPLNWSVLCQFSKLQIDFSDFEGAKKNLILARETIQQISTPFRYGIEPNWIEIATLQINSGDWKEANLTLGLVKALALESESHQDYKNRILGEVSALQASVQDIIGAKDTVNSIEHPSKKAEALSEIAMIQAKNGDIIGAKQTVELVEDFTKQQIAFEKIALEQAKSQDHVGAMETINLMHASFPKILAFRNIAIVQIELGHFEAALLTANKMIDLERKNLVLQDLAIKQAETTAFEKAKITVHEIRDFSIKTHTLIKIASQQIRALDFSGANETLAQAKTIENYPDRAKCLALIIKQEVKFNKLGALATIKILKTLVPSIKFVLYDVDLNDTLFDLIKELHSIVF